MKLRSFTMYIVSGMFLILLSVPLQITCADRGIWSEMILEQKKQLLNNLWQDIMNHPEQRIVIVHLIRRAYHHTYPIPVEINTLLKAENLDPDDAIVLEATRSLFTLSNPKDPFHSGIKRKK